MKYLEKAHEDKFVTDYIVVISNVLNTQDAQAAQAQLDAQNARKKTVEYKMPEGFGLDPTLVDEYCEARRKIDDVVGAKYNNYAYKKLRQAWKKILKHKDTKKCARELAGWRLCLPGKLKGDEMFKKGAIMVDVDNGKKGTLVQIIKMEEAGINNRNHKYSVTYTNG